MKAPKKGKDKKNNVIKQSSKKSAVTKGKPPSISKEKVLVVAQEIKYARLLSGNEKKTRDRVLKALKKWLTNCFEKGYEFKEDDFTRVWKGLFYAVWMSDKPLVQEELCESIAGILDIFPPEQLRHALLMTKAGFKTLATEWYGIDQHRMDKFLMLVRRYLRGSLRVLARGGWTELSCKQYCKMLSGTDGLFALKTPHYARNALSMQLHIVDCFLEELAKVSEGKIPSSSVAAILRVFTTYTCGGEVGALCVATRRQLTALLRQSEEGLRYADRTRAWQKMGCPGEGPDSLVLASDDEEDPQETGEGEGDAASDEDDSGPLDPRAGRVDVVLPLLPVPSQQLAAMLREALPATTSKAHKRVRICLQRLEQLAGGEYPLRVSVPPAPAPAPAPGPAGGRRAARALRALEAKLKSDADELKLRGLSRKHRKRLLKKTRLGQSIVEELQTVPRASRTRHNNGEWLVESTKTETDLEKDTSNKENQKTKNKSPKDKPQKRKLDAPNGDVAKKQKLDEKKVKVSVKDSSKKVKEVKEKRILEVKEAKEKRILEVKEVKEKRILEKETNKQTNKTKDKKVVDKVEPKKAQVEPPKVLINKLRNFSKQLKNDKKDDRSFSKKLKKDDRSFEKNLKQNDNKNIKNTRVFETPKKVKFVLKNNSMQKPVDYYKSVRQSPSIPYDGTKQPIKTNLKPSTPSPINPFFKKKLRRH